MRRVALVWLTAMLMPSAASAEERILRFYSDVQINRDSTVDVTETIDVRSEGVDIKRGIYRDFPTRYYGPRGTRIRVGFTFVGAERDGQSENAVTESIANGVRIRIGKEDVFLEPGEHRYVIRYRTTRQLGFFDDYDELDWNVTGNDWAFPIDDAEVRIALPSPASFGRRAVYTGPEGATGQMAAVVSEKPGEIVFHNTAPLGPHEGLTVAVSWPKGVIPEPSGDQRRRYWLADNGPLLAGLVGLIGVIGFYFFAWKRAGRDPRPGTVVPIFSPPDDLSPAAMRYIWKMKADNRAFAAALVDLGVKGHVRLVEEEGGWLSSDKTRIERLAGGEELPAAEQAMLGELAMSGDSVVMEQKNHARFRAAREALDEDFKTRFDDKLFHRNWGWAAAGLAVFLAALLFAAVVIALAMGTAVPTSALIVAGALASAGLLTLASRGLPTIAGCTTSALATGLLALALYYGGPMVAAALASGWYWPFAPLLLAVPLVLSAFWWMSAPTREGRRVLDRIAGFRQYLSIAERERLDRMTAPEDTPKIFERYLPYAIALGVENSWADRFHGVLAAAAAQGQQGFAWYSGNQSPWSDTGGFVSDVGSSLASSISSASAAPGSSSGSGGGGSSGGGGGGGGGGGW